MEAMSLLSEVSSGLYWPSYSQPAILPVFFLHICVRREEK